MTTVILLAANESQPMDWPEAIAFLGAMAMFAFVIWAFTR